MDITLGVRPEHIRLGAPASDRETGFRGHCELVEYLGAKQLVHLRVGQDQVVMVVGAAEDVAAGDTLDCRTALDRIQLFDTASGRALTRPSAVVA